MQVGIIQMAMTDALAALLRVGALVAALLILSRIKSPLRYGGFVLLLMTFAGPMMSEHMITRSLEPFDVAPADAVTFGSTVELQHVTTLARDPVNSWLYADWMNYWHAGTSGQRQVQVYGGFHYRNMFLVKGTVDQGPNYKPGAPVADGTIIRLQNRWETQGNLHSHNAVSPFADNKFGEVTTFGSRESDDTNSHWQILVEGGGMWSASSRVALLHVNTGKYLHSFDTKHRVFSDPNNQWAVQTVMTSPSKTADSMWVVHRLEQPNTPAVRIYHEATYPEARMDEYLKLGNSSEVVSNKLRDGRVGNEFIKSIIVPQGFSVDCYRSENKQDYLTTLDEGLHDNVDIGTVKTLVARPACAVIAYENCDGTGRSQCVPYGTSSISFGAMGWRTSNPDAMVKVYNSDSEWLLQKGQKTVSCSKSMNPTFGAATDITVTPPGTLMALYRTQTDPASQGSFSVTRANSLPTLSFDDKSSLRVYLNAAKLDSYTPGSRIWKDLSGNNKHFVWQKQPRWGDGKFLTSDTDGGLCTGDPSNSFGLGDGTQGYTVVLVSQAQGSSNHWGCFFYSQSGDPHNLSCHIPWSDDTLYFDNAWGSPGGSNRLTAASGSQFNKYFMNVVVLRRSSNDRGARQSIWVNGLKLSESAVGYAKELDLGTREAGIFNGYRGSPQAFAIWSTDLSDSDIVTVSGHFAAVYNSFIVAQSLPKQQVVQTTVPTLPITIGLRCLLDARDNRSAQVGSTIWRDLSGWDNHFRWISTPSLEAGAFRQIDKAGTGLLGPASDSMGIEGGGGDYTVFFVARTNVMSNNQAFRFSGDTQLSRAIFVHPSWTDSNVYFDSAGCCVQNQQRLQVKVQPNKLAVYAVRCTPGFYFNTVLQARGQDIFKTAGLNRKSIFVDGQKVAESSQDTLITIFNNKPVEIGASKTENYDWKADIAGFAVYNRALTDSEVAKMSAWFNKPKYGSATKPDGTIDPDVNIKPGVCVNMETSSKVYSAAECLSKTANADGSYSRAAGNGSGWCYTDPKDKSKWGYCRTTRTVDIDSSIDKTVPLSYVGAREYCENKGGRLCNIDELCDSGSSAPAAVGYDTLNATDCASAGGVYNAKGGFCGTAETGGKIPFYIPAGQNFAPVNDYENAWVNLSGDDSSATCRTFDSLNGGNLPSWGTDNSDIPQRRNLVCCGTKTLSECDKLAIHMKTIEDKLAEARDDGTRGQLQLQKDATRRQQMEKCMTETYLKAVNDLADAEAQYNKLVKNVTDTHADRLELAAQLKQLFGVTDSKGNVYFDIADATANGGAPLPDGSYTETGVIPTLRRNLADTQAAIAAQIARYNACPKDPTCPTPDKNKVVPPANANAKCDPSTLKTALLNNPSLTPEKLQLLSSLLTTENILKSTDIRTHKDFYKLVNAQNLHSCSDLGTGPALQPRVTDFDIKDHPDYQKGHLVPLLSVDLARVPTDRLPDALRLQGKTAVDILKSS